MKTRVVNLRTEPTPGAVYIGRAGHGHDGYFGNPFQITQYQTRRKVLDLYEHWFWGKLQTDAEFHRRILELRGKTLACFCKPLACHGDVIAKFLNAERKEDLL